MFLTQIQSSQPWVLPPPRVLRHSHFSSTTIINTRRFLPCRFGWNKSSALNVHGLRAQGEGRWEVGSHRSDIKSNSNTSKHVPETFGTKFPWMENTTTTTSQAENMIQSMSLYFILRLIHKKFLDPMINVVQSILPDLLQTLSVITSLPLACISNSLNKPKPLHLDVSLPSFRDLTWSLARLLYLFNIQVERNVATFFIVLLVACFSFVVIGGLLFFKLSNQLVLSLLLAFFLQYGVYCFTLAF